jgi:hypothetical protein
VSKKADRTQADMLVVTVSRVQIPSQQEPATRNVSRARLQRSSYEWSTEATGWQNWQGADEAYFAGREVSPCQYLKQINSNKYALGEVRE